MKLICTTCIIALIALTGCTTTGTIQSGSTSASGSVTVPSTSDDPLATASHALENHPLSNFIIQDAQTAAKMARDNGFPARAGRYEAKIVEVRAWQAQVDACKAAIKTAAQSLVPQTTGGTVGLITLGEMAAERLGQSLPPAVLVNCKPIVLP